MQECFFSSRRLSPAKCTYGAKPRSRFYDAENRLTSCETTAAAVAAGVPKQRLEFAYDWIGRRIQKVVKAWNTTTSSYQVSSDTRFLYDGWNLVAEFNVSGSTFNVARTYVWGIDLSGSLRGAGGVGGLLAVNTSSATYFPTFDGSGNVTGLVNAATGSLDAEYEYDPFGVVIKAVGAAANAQPFGFSTKFTDTETNLVYYGMRWYSPNVGRFITRDPINERGGSNLYAMVFNNPVSLYDYLGLDDSGEEASTPIEHSEFLKQLGTLRGEPLTEAEMKIVTEQGCIGVSQIESVIRPSDQEAFMKGNKIPPQSTRASAPEWADKVTCFKGPTAQSLAAQLKCTDCERKLVFSVQGDWKNGDEPLDGELSDNDVIDHKKSFNYLTVVNGKYVYLDYGTGGEKNRKKSAGYIRKTPFHYKTTEIWCSKCIPKAK